MIYLDNAATTKPCREAVDAVMNACAEFGNPSSLHRLGLGAEKIIKNAKKSVADLMGAAPENIYFTSGGTEANNMAIFGAARASRKKHIITTKIEHPSVLEPFRRLEREGFFVDYIGVDAQGTVNLDELYKRLDSDAALVSMMHVNDETGTVQPVEEVRQIIKERAPDALFHIDAVQSYAKLPLQVKKLGADLISVSAHKINALKGCGALYIGQGRIEPLIIGGGQQKNMRSGTENVTGIAAFGAAARVHKADNRERIAELRKRLKDGIFERIPDVKYNGGESFSPYVLNVSFLGIKAEILLHSLEARRIYVSTVSACSSNKPMPSHVLSAMGCTPKEIEGAIRMSFDNTLAEPDIELALCALCDEVAKIRKYMR